VHLRLGQAARYHARKTKHRGIARVAADFLLNLIAYNPIRIPKLMAAQQTPVVMQSVRLQKSLPNPSPKTSPRERNLDSLCFSANC
jgi:hypothetical protein